MIIAAFVLKPSSAFALTADDIINKMDSKQQTAYITGLIGGFAYSRYLQDKPDKEGMNCIYNWFHGVNNTTAWERIETWFSRNLEVQAEPLLYVLVKRECGE